MTISDDFERIDAALRAWPRPLDPVAEMSTAARRLLHAAGAAAETPQMVGTADLALLLRHVLRADAEASGTSKSLPVPHGAPWPGPEDWARFDMHGSLVGDLQRVFADPWMPEWLDAGGEDPAASAFRGFNRPRIGAADAEPADPYLTEATGLGTYRSVGQRETIRTILAAAPDATVIGNLPTGSGKSLAAYIEALVSRSPGTTLVVVPTTSLAIDQERAFHELIGDRGGAARFPKRLCYETELKPEARAEIRRQIADGSQGIVFTSPESLIGSLSSAIYAAAERGLLRSFVIDEAHIVSQWGTEFRPAFQALAGVRSDLLGIAANAGCPFRTVLLSATLTEESIFTLQRLFGQPGPTELISSVALRHEPSYWLASSTDAIERHERILEAIRRLPRPMILYTTRVDAAKEWLARLHSDGFTRIMLVAGETSAGERREAIRRLRAHALDLVVATSAFGLGVDQPDVRAVVHACVPETIDRFYQEVGRGGRDGLPSVSLLVEGPGDRATAASLASPKLISLQRGFQRWRMMQINAHRDDVGRLHLPLDVSPPDLAGDNDANRAWNMRTLLLMSRSGLLSLNASPPPRQAVGESDEDWERRAPAAFATYSATAVVTAEGGGLADQEVWDQAVHVARSRAIAGDREARTRMERALEPGTQVCQLFEPIPGISPTQIPVPVAPSCGGCPGCRSAGLPPRRYQAAIPLPAVNTAHTWTPEFRPWFAGRHVLVVTYQVSIDWPRTLIRALERLAGRGMWCLVAPDVIRRAPAVRQLHHRAASGAIFELRSWDLLHAPLLPTGLVIAPDEGLPPDVLQDDEPRRVVFVPAHARAPGHPTATIDEYYVSVTVQDLLER
jgi:ATP-dependent DNA helicase RecQ